MKKKIFALCDSEEVYLQRMVEYLEEKEALPFLIHAFTGVEELKKFNSQKEIELLLVAESCYTREVKDMNIGNLMILNESGNKIGEDITNISKYQSSEKILGEVLRAYSGGNEDACRRITSGSQMMIIGNYTPIGRCLQTTFAMSLGQILAQKHKVLYLNFESYSGFGCLMERDFTMDITDALYFFNCERGKFAYRLAGMVQSVNGMDLIPPVVSFKDLHTITGEQWLDLFREIESISGYEYLILDLSEQMNGLFEILRSCYRVYTITREDRIAAAKIKQYETMLMLEEYQDVAAKTRKWSLPVFHTLPSGLEQLTHGELAAYVKGVVEEDIYDRAG